MKNIITKIIIKVKTEYDGDEIYGSTNSFDRKLLEMAEVNLNTERNLLSEIVIGVS